MIDRVLRGLIGSVKALPYHRRVPTMGRILARGIGPLAGYRKRAIANLALIYPDMAESQRHTIATAVCDNFGRTLIENFSHEDFGNHLAGTIPTGAGLQVAQDAKAAGQPVIFVTGHYGNHEAPRHVLTRMGFTIGGLYRPMKNRYFNDHYARTMTSWGGPVFAQGPETRGFARMIRAGHMGTLLFDVRASKGIPIDFMGHPALTATSAADMALKFGAVVIPYFGKRKADGLSFDVTLEEPIAADSAAAMTQEMTARLEARITAAPAQWFWVHRRWK